MQILVVNAGSSSVKLRLLDDADDLVASSDLPVQDPPVCSAACSGTFLDEHPEVVAVGHRVVDGGSVPFRGPVVIDDRAEATLRTLTPTSPPCTTRSAWLRSGRVARAETGPRPR